MTVVAVPNREFPPAGDALGQAAVVIESLDRLRPELLDSVDGRRR
jgi:hypothetical protein